MFSCNETKACERIRSEELNRHFIQHARALIASNYPVCRADEESLCIEFGDFYLDVEFEDHDIPIMILSVNRELYGPMSHRRQRNINRMNLENMLGQHVVDDILGHYLYRLPYLLESPLELPRLDTMVGFCYTEALRGYDRLAKC